MRLLLAEDDLRLGSVMQAVLSRAGYAADWVQNGRDFDAALATHHYECAVLDLGLPDTTGDALLQKLRLHDGRLPVIVVTARHCVQERISVLNHGADDFLVKPFDMEELTARLRSLLRRSAHDKTESDALSHGSLRLFPQRCTAAWKDDAVPLTRREYSVLEALVRRKDQVVTRARLEEILYSWDEEVNSNTVEVYIHYLRKKFHPTLIRTVRGVGYQLAAADHA